MKNILEKTGTTVKFIMKDKQFVMKVNLNINLKNGKKENHGIKRDSI